MQRWEDLFADLEAQMRDAERREWSAEVSDRTRRERSEVSWVDRVAASIGATITLSTQAGQVVGRLDDVGKDWLLVGDPAGRHPTLVPQRAVLSVQGLHRTAQVDEGLGRRFGMGMALRAISRDRAPVEVRDVIAQPVAGTIDVVGADYIEIAEHPVDLPRRAEHVTGQRVVTLQSVAYVRRG